MVARFVDIPEIIEVDRLTGTLRFNFHRGQAEVMRSTATITAAIAGSQSGKTVCGVAWILDKMTALGPGDYLVAAPTDGLLDAKLIPTFKRVFVDLLTLGVFIDTPRPEFRLSKAGARRLWQIEPDEPTRVLFGYAAKPTSLESMTVKAVLLDEAGSPEFKTGSWEAILRRRAVYEGPILIMTTPYTVGHWLKRRVFDRRHDPRESIKVIRFRSIDNPAFPRASLELARRDMPRWRFEMFYEGKWTKPAGQIYDAFDQTGMAIPRFPIPERWPRYLGLDFGAVNTWGLYLAECPETQDLYAYRLYHAANRTAVQHVEAIMRGEKRAFHAVYGGAKSEQQWRDEFTAAGLDVLLPLADDVEIGIDRVAALHETTADLIVAARSGQHAAGGYYVFDDLDDYLREKAEYSRKVDPEGEPLEEIENKRAFHIMDAERYLVGSIRGVAIQRARQGGYTVTEQDERDRLDALIRHGYVSREFD